MGVYNVNKSIINAPELFYEREELSDVLDVNNVVRSVPDLLCIMSNIPEFFYDREEFLVVLDLNKSIINVQELFRSMDDVREHFCSMDNVLENVREESLDVVPDASCFPGQVSSIFFLNC